VLPPKNQKPFHWTCVSKNVHQPPLASVGASKRQIKFSRFLEPWGNFSIQRRRTRNTRSDWNVVYYRSSGRLSGDFGGFLSPTPGRKSSMPSVFSNVLCYQVLVKLTVYWILWGDWSLFQGLVAARSRGRLTDWYMNCYIGWLSSCLQTAGGMIWHLPAFLWGCYQLRGDRGLEQVLRAKLILYLPGLGLSYITG
jgi:hypothetical protein